MERWGVAVNDVYKNGHVYRLQGPWYIFFIEWLSDFVCGMFHKLPSIPMPKWHTCKYCFFGPKYLEDGEVSTLYEEYGDLAGLVHVRFCDPVMQWCYRKYDETRMTADIDDLSAFYKWIKEMQDYEDDDDDHDPWLDHPKFLELQQAREQIVALWSKRRKLADELIAIKRGTSG